MPAAAQRRYRPPGRDCALRDQLTGIAAEPGDHAVDQRIVRGSVNLGDRDPVLNRREHANLPIGDMAGKDDHPPAGGDGPVHVLEAVRLNPAARFEDADFAEVRVFGSHATEIVPHASDDTSNLAIGQLGEGAFDITPRAFGDPEKGADTTSYHTPEGRSAIERQ